MQTKYGVWETKNYKYVDREEDPDLKRIYEDELLKFEKLSE